MYICGVYECYVSIYMCMYTCNCGCVCVCACVRVRVHVCARVYVCVYMCACVTGRCVRGHETKHIFRGNYRGTYTPTQEADDQLSYSVTSLHNKSVDSLTQIRALGSVSSPPQPTSKCLATNFRIVL